MTKSARSMTMLLLFCGVLVLVGSSRAQTRSVIVEQLAKTYGPAATRFEGESLPDVDLGAQDRPSDIRKQR